MNPIQGVSRTPVLAPTPVAPRIQGPATEAQEGVQAERTERQAGRTEPQEAPMPSAHSGLGGNLSLYA